MDYIANSKLMGEYMEKFMFPSDDNRIKDFMMLSTEDQLNAISLGVFMLKQGKNRSICKKFENNLQLIQQLKTEYEEKIIKNNLVEIKKETQNN